ncbi:MAG: hypothetical protein M3478_08160 [Planctomycetota bacterium]|nr:hypothetical protein [Planctomycetota bacterium]
MAEPLDRARIAFLVRRGYGAQSREQICGDFVAMRMPLNPVGNPLKLGERVSANLRFDAVTRDALQLVLQQARPPSVAEYEVNAVVQAVPLERLPLVRVEPDAGAGAAPVDAERHAVTDAVTAHQLSALRADLRPRRVCDRTSDIVWNRFRDAIGVLQPAVVLFAAYELTGANRTAPRRQQWFRLSRAQRRGHARWASYERRERAGSLRAHDEILWPHRGTAA